MDCRVEVEPEAIVEIDRILSWLIQEASERVAANWYAGLVQSLSSLRRHPGRCPVARENEYFEEEIRCLMYGKYRLLFDVSDRTVRVLHIRHGARKSIGEE